jgi:hypothetical protein
MAARPVRHLVAVATAAATLLVTACGHPFVPSSIGTQVASASAQSTSRISAITTGVDLYITSNYSLSETEALGKRDIAWIARSLGVQAIGIAWDLSVPSDNSDEVLSKSPVTPSIADIQALTLIAQAYHLKVEYRILFRVDGKDGATESLRPQSQRLWFTSLLSAETPYLQLAAESNVHEFIVGTELSNFEGSAEWPRFFNDASAIYPGILSYASWGGNFFSSHRQLPPVADYGVTAYPSVKLPDSATVAQLTAAWTAFLNTAPVSTLRRTAIDEIGIPAEVGAYADPWAWNGQHGTQDDQVQARWFEAACDSAIATHIRAIFFWNVNLIDNPIHPFTSLVKFEGRPESESAIRNCGKSKD